MSKDISAQLWEWLHSRPIASTPPPFHETLIYEAVAEIERLLEQIDNLKEWREIAKEARSALRAIKDDSVTHEHAQAIASEALWENT